MGRYKIALIVFLCFPAFWLFTDLDYDHREPNSLERMMKWSPAKANALLEDFSIAANNPYGTNLTGLNAVEIRELADKRRAKMNARQQELIINRNMGRD